jgi:hypothetical protein
MLLPMAAGEKLTFVIAGIAERDGRFYKRMTIITKRNGPGLPRGPGCAAMAPLLQSGSSFRAIPARLRGRQCGLRTPAPVVEVHSPDERDLCLNR